MGVELITVTPNAEALLAKMARVSSSNPDNPEFAKLIKYLIDHKHWSPFEMVHMVVGFTTSRAIAAQILRHRSFTFQELSQRYTSAIDFPVAVVGRRQSDKNRQAGNGPELEPLAQDTWLDLQEDIYTQAYEAYEKALKIGVSREQARLLLPLATPTDMYMSGSLRSWIHYLQLRTQPDTQQEHRQLAINIKSIFIDNFPITSGALGWDHESNT